MEAKGCIIPYVKNVNKTWKGQIREAWGVKVANNGGKRVPIMTKDDNGAISKKNCTKMHMAQRKCSSSYHGSYFIVMM